MKILLTNDDGVDSPALVPTIRSINSLGWDVDVIVPEAQRSGFSKATTRRGELRIEEIERGGYPVTILHGATPADCSNYGIFRGRRPDLVISGANVGSNLDIGHYFSSGTIGASIESILLGVPSVAVSLCYTTEALMEENFTRALSPFPDLLATIGEGFPKGIMGLSVNYPLTPTRGGYYASRLGDLKIAQLFEEHGGIVSLRRQKWSYTPDECEHGTDRWAISQGVASIIALDERALPVENGRIAAVFDRLNFVEL